MISFGRDRGDFWLFLLLTLDEWCRPRGVLPHLCERIFGTFGMGFRERSL